MLAGEAAWCPPVRLELWRGVRTDKEARVLQEYEQVLPEYPIGDEIWEQSCELAHRCRRHGKTAPFADILIATCVRHYKLKVAYDDAHFEFLMVL